MTSPKEFCDAVLEDLRYSDPRGVNSPDVHWSESDSEVITLRYFLPEGCELLYGEDRVNHLKPIVLAEVKSITDAGGLDMDPADAMLHASSIILRKIKMIIPEYNMGDIANCKGSKLLLKEMSKSFDIDQKVKQHSRLSCGQCNRSYPSKRCSCKNVYYCDIDCQRAHWVEHRKNAAHKAFRDK